MLQVTSTLRGCVLEVSDGIIGKVTDLLFDDATWRMRWLVVDVGSWLTGRKVLIHPSAIQSSDPDQRSMRLDLNKAQIKASPGIAIDQPVSRQLESSLYGYYGWDPRWDTGIMGGGGLGFPSVLQARFGETLRKAAPSDPLLDGGDPHLRSIAIVTGYHVHATDGGIGHVENFLIDSGDWGIRYLIIDTKNWWGGKRVLLSPHAINDIRWLDRQIRLDVSRDQVRNSPPWSPLDRIDRSYEKQLHQHYGWPGYGW